MWVESVSQLPPKIVAPFLIIFFANSPNTLTVISSLFPKVIFGFFPTGVAWLLRFHILKNNGVIFQSQVAFLIPIFGVILGYIFLNELITSKVIVSLLLVILGIYLVKTSNKIKVTSV